MSKNIAVLLSVLFIACSFTNAVGQPAKEEVIQEVEVGQHWWDDWEGDLNRNHIHDLIEEKPKDERISIFINYDRPTEKEDVERLAGFDFDVKYVYKCIEVICARDVAVKDVKTVASLPHVVMVKLEPVFYPNLDVSTKAIKARESEEYSPNTAWELGFTGNGISIAILDTGVDDSGRSPTSRHDFLDDQDDNPATSDPKLVAGVDFTQEETLFTPRDGSYNPDDTHGHGTHCAGIAMGTGGPNAYYVGVAPQANLVDVKVMEDWAPNQWGEVIAGIDWCIEHRNDFNIRVLSLSLGGGDSDGTDEGSRAVNRAVEQGLVVVVAIGNDGDPPPRGDGVADNSNEVPAPAAADMSISVGSVYDHESIDRSDDTLSDFSFTGPRKDDGDDDPYDELKPDVCAYGEDIESALANTASGTTSQSGTSMACPHVAGVAALMLEASPKLTPDKLRELLRMSAEPRGSPSYPQLDSKYNTQYGWGIVDAYRAVELARGFVEVEVFIDKPTEDVTLSGTTSISGRASVDKGSLSKVEVSIEDPNFSSYTLEAEGTDVWSVEWDTRGWNGYLTIYAKATSGDYYAVTSVDVWVHNEDEGGDGGASSGDEGPPTIDLFGVGKISVYAVGGFVAIVAGIVVLVIAGVLLKRRRLYKEMLAERQQKEEGKGSASEQSMVNQ
ncbi:MAG: S8 family serine peptidase [Thermoplasmata archaeon]|nr:MAG: S8 family serine peptidase [Thermoplasmata archaeon]